MTYLDHRHYAPKKCIKPFASHRITRAQKEWKCRGCPTVILKGHEYVKVEVMPTVGAKYPVSNAFCSVHCLQNVFQFEFNEYLSLVTGIRYQGMAVFDSSFGAMRFSRRGTAFLITEGWKLLPYPKQVLPEQTGLFQKDRTNGHHPVNEDRGAGLHGDSGEGAGGEAENHNAGALPDRRNGA